MNDSDEVSSAQDRVNESPAKDLGKTITYVVKCQCAHKVMWWSVRESGQ